MDSELIVAAKKIAAKLDEVFRDYGSTWHNIRRGEGGFIYKVERRINSKTYMVTYECTQYEMLTTPEYAIVHKAATYIFNHFIFAHLQ